MKREDWICPKCGNARTASMCGRYMTCTFCCSKMHNLWAVKDLPVATRVDYKRFLVKGAISADGFVQYWEYVPHAHAGCMTRAPAEGHVVAKVRLAHGMTPTRIRPMVFRRCKPPRERCPEGWVPISKPAVGSYAAGADPANRKSHGHSVALVEALRASQLLAR